MSDFPKTLRAYPGDPAVVITRSFVEELAAHIERIEAELAAECGRALEEAARVAEDVINGCREDGETDLRAIRSRLEYAILALKECRDE
jgi:vacuolar-type H+-ATPase subunit E/Vma4